MPSEVFSKFRKWIDWPPTGWIVTTLLSLATMVGGFIGVAVYKAYVGDPIDSVKQEAHDANDAINGRLDKVEQQQQKQAERIARIDQKIDTLIINQPLHRMSQVSQR